MVGNAERSRTATTITNNYIDFGGAVYTFAAIEKLESTKENAFLKYISMIVKAWPVERMTDAEKQSLFAALRFADSQKLVSGSFRKRWDGFQAVYHAFLLGLGCTSHKWRASA